MPRTQLRRKAAAQQPPALVDEAPACVVAEQMGDVVTVGCDDEFERAAAVRCGPFGAVVDQCACNSATPVSGSNEQILQFGDAAVFESKAESGDREARYLIIGTALSGLLTIANIVAARQHS